MKAFARYANDASGLTRIEGLRNNSENISEGRKCFIEAKRDIKAGEEILVGYGRWFWSLQRKLMKEKLKQN
jgi:SET domain-containing protein